MPSKKRVPRLLETTGQQHCLSERRAEAQPYRKLKRKVARTKRAFSPGFKGKRVKLLAKAAQKGNRKDCQLRWEPKGRGIVARGSNEGEGKQRHSGRCLQRAPFTRGGGSAYRRWGVCLCERDERVLHRQQQRPSKSPCLPEDFENGLGWNVRVEEGGGGGVSSASFSFLACLMLAFDDAARALSLPSGGSEHTSTGVERAWLTCDKLRLFHKAGGGD